MPLRLEPFHKAEQSSQLLFGERVEIIEVNNRDWAHIHNPWDGYKSWGKLSQLAMISKKDFKKESRFLTGSHTDRLVLPSGDMWLPYGCELRGMKAGKMEIANDKGKFKGKKLKIDDLTLTGDNVKAAAMVYMNAPYQWGGKTIMGIDCSGLTQMAYRLCNHAIPRDADQQANEGTLVDFLQHATCGDLAFFDNKDGKIVHVGILLDNQTILHATDTAGRVVIDRIDQAGIISTSLKMRTHNLRLVKRMIPG